MALFAVARIFLGQQFALTEAVLSIVKMMQECARMEAVNAAELATMKKSLVSDV